MSEAASPLATVAHRERPSGAARLLAEALSDPYGVITASDYDTAIVATLPSSLRPDGVRDFLLRGQNPDGSWGSPFWPGAYRLVPTLAATATLLQQAPAHLDTAVRALGFLHRYPGDFDCRALPDTVAVEHLVPALVDRITASGGAWIADEALNTLGGKVAHCDRDGWLRLRSAARAGAALPTHVAHCLDLFGDDVEHVRATPSRLGGYGCSPAATAAVLATSATPSTSAVAYLHRAAAQAGAGLPTILPIATMERAWTANVLLKAGVPLPPALRRRLALSLRACLGPGGAAIADGLPPDADDTAVILTVLADLGVPADAGCLASFEGDGWFHTYSERERTPSLTVNAHVLEALARYGRGVHKPLEYVLSSQCADGGWPSDKWHASPYYATSCCVSALRPHAGKAGRSVVQRAIQWLAATQRDDGSWGVWTGTLEETAHAVLMLRLAGGIEQRRAIDRGVDFLGQNADAPPSDSVRTPLWHGKQLFEPSRIVHALVTSALECSPGDR